MEPLASKSIYSMMNTQDRYSKTRLGGVRPQERLSNESPKQKAGRKVFLPSLATGYEIAGHKSRPVMARRRLKSVEQGAEGSRKQPGVEHPNLRRAGPGNRQTTDFKTLCDTRATNSDQVTGGSAFREELTPMERWEKESFWDQPWNNLAWCGPNTHVERAK